MIGSISGTITDILPDSVIVETGGVGYRVETAVLPVQTGEACRLYIHTHVREQELRLFGFTTRQELFLFEQLLSVSGVGPKMALGLLRAMDYASVVGAIVTGDVAALKAPGVGRKTAERIVVDLKSKLQKAHAEMPARPEKRAGSSMDEVVSALLSLGFSEAEIDSISGQIEEGKVHDMIKQALKLIRT